MLFPAYPPVSEEKKKFYLWKRKLKDKVKACLPQSMIVRLRTNRFFQILAHEPLTFDGKFRDGSALLTKGVYQTDVTIGERRALLAALYERFRENGIVSYLEIGVLGGGTIKFLLDQIPTLRCTGVDLFEDFMPSGDNTHGSPTYRLEDVRQSLGSEVMLLKGDTNQILPRLKAETQTFDLIFIDANHTYAGCRADFENSALLLKPGGYIAFHSGSVQYHPDYKYIVIDGGPWKVTQEIRRLPQFDLAIEVERMRIFQLKV